MSSICFFVASVSVQWLCFLDLLHEQVFVFTSLSFGGGGACYGLISAEMTNLMVIKMHVSARRFALPYTIMTHLPS